MFCVDRWSSFWKDKLVTKVQEKKIRSEGSTYKKGCKAFLLKKVNIACISESSSFGKLLRISR